jgi:hypothetical protein
MFSIFFHSNDLGFTCKVFIALSLCPPTIDLMKVIHAFNVVIDNWPALNLIKSNENPTCRNSLCDENFCSEIPKMQLSSLFSVVHSCRT